MQTIMDLVLPQHKLGLVWECADHYTAREVHGCPTRRQATSKILSIKNWRGTRGIICRLGHTRREDGGLGWASSCGTEQIDTLLGMRV
jgi:hypothetical protein